MKMDETGNIAGNDAIARGLVRAVLRTAGFRRLLRALVAEALGAWSGRNPFKKIIAGFVRRSVNSSYPDRGAVTLAGQVNDGYRDNPAFLAETLAPAVRRFIEKTDFGEMKEAIESSARDLPALAREFGNGMMDYPAKLVSIYATAPPLANSLAAVLNETLAPLNKLSPDLLADVVCSLAGEIDTNEAARLVNSLAELARKLHTGSGLMGASGSPSLTGRLADLAAETAREIDVPLLVKSLELLDEMKEQFHDRLRDIQDDHPEFVRGMITRRFRRAGRAVRSWSRDWDQAEGLFSDEEFADMAGEGMGEIDPQDLAETVNRVLAALNRVREINPDLIKNSVRQVADTLDPNELGKTARWAAEDLAGSLKPAAGAVMPHLVKGFTELIRPGEDDNGDMREALDGLRNLLLGKEAGNE